jgi:signal transduction histidine kinase
VTADLLPPQTAAESGVGPTHAADVVQLTSNFVAEVTLRAKDAPVEHVLSPDLATVERAFGKHFFDKRARAGIEAAQARAARLSTAAGGVSDATALLFAADIFVSLAVERTWGAGDVRNLTTKLGEGLDATPQAVSAGLLTAALRAPQLLDLPPRVAIEVQLSMLASLSPVVEASLWATDEAGRVECIVCVGATATTRRFRAVAAHTLDGQRPDDAAGMIIGVTVRRFQMPAAALVVRTSSREAACASLWEAAEACSPLLERELLLQRGAARERSLVTASERRLSRLGFDLHDGALQHVAALGADLRQLARQSGDAHMSRQIGRLDDRVLELERTLRELAHSLEPKSLLRRPLADVVESEAAALRERTGMAVETQITGDFGSMTQSQKIALIRVLQEAFTNIREHSNATRVEVAVAAGRSCVELQVVDDGDGFEVTRTLQQAAQRGRLGLVGSSERVRLLGGTFDIRSKRGGPTTVALALPRWQPLLGDQESQLELAHS